MKTFTFLLLLLCVSSGFSKDLIFRKYRYYVPYISSTPYIQGLDSGIYVSGRKLSYVRQIAGNLYGARPHSIYRRSAYDWMAVSRIKGKTFLRVYDKDNSFNCRAQVDMRNGRLYIHRGVDFEGYSDAHDAKLSARLLLDYLELNIKKVYTSPKNIYNQRYISFIHLGGIPVSVHLSPAEISFCRRMLSLLDSMDAISLARVDRAHWMDLKLVNNGTLLRIHDKTRAFNCRAKIDLNTGKITVLKGVNYHPGSGRYSDNAELTALDARDYLRKVFILSELDKPSQAVFSIIKQTPDANVIANLIEKYLSGFKYNTSKFINRPAVIKRLGTLDGDDYALYAWMLFTLKNVDCRIIEINTDTKGTKVFTIAYRTMSGWYSMRYDNKSVNGVASLCEIVKNAVKTSTGYRTIDPLKDWLSDSISAQSDYQIEEKEIELNIEE